MPEKIILPNIDGITIPQEFFNMIFTHSPIKWPENLPNLICWKERIGLVSNFRNSKKYIRDLAEDQVPRRLNNENNLKHEKYDMDSITGCD